MTDFTINSQTVTASVAVTKMAGDMAGEYFDMLEDEFNRLLESGIRGLVLDFAGVDALSSAGLGAIINMSHILADRNGKLFVAAPRPKVLGVIEMLGLTEVITIVDSPEQAKKMASSIR